MRLSVNAQQALYLVEIGAYLGMLVALWLRRGPYLWFAIVQSLWLIETVLLTIWVHDPFWFSSNVFDIFASIIIGLCVWRLMPGVTLLMLFWSLLSIIQYRGMNLFTRGEFWQEATCFYLAKIVDLCINGVVIWYILAEQRMTSTQRSDLATGM